MNRDMQEMFLKVQKAAQDKTKHKAQAESLKKDIANDDREELVAKGKIIDYICRQKNISLEILCEYLMAVEITPKSIRRETTDIERKDTNE
ncbi:MAG: hypothetical protein IKH75_08115 [Ruminococcus sp.]|nr:hypothetical protein [Ruminococcus sp.]